MDLERLAEIPLLASLPNEEQEAIARIADELEVPAGTQLIEQGALAYRTGRRPPWVDENADAFFLVESGMAAVTRDGEQVAQLGRGAFFGEIGLIETGERNASVTAASPLRLIVLYGALTRLEREAPQFMRQVRAAATERDPGRGR